MPNRLPTHLNPRRRPFSNVYIANEPRANQDDPDEQPFLNFLFDGPVSLDVNVKLSPLAAMIIIMFIVVLIVAIITIYRTFNTMYILNKM